MENLGKTMETGLNPVVFPGLGLCPWSARLLGATRPSSSTTRWNSAKLT